MNDVHILYFRARVGKDCALERDIKVPMHNSFICRWLLRVKSQERTKKVFKITVFNRHLSGNQQPESV